MAQESEWQFHEPDPRQAGGGFGSLCLCVWLSPHLCITDALGSDALGTNQYLGLWHSCKSSAGTHGCSITTSPLPLVGDREWLWGILAWEVTAPVATFTKGIIHVPSECGCGGRRGKENI